MTEARWLRKLSEEESNMNTLAQNGDLLVAYRLSLCARRPLKAEEVKQALTHLYRKTPNLRVCLGQREDEMWFKEMQQENIDFEVSTMDVDEATDYMHTKTYPQDALLWLARLLPVSSPRYQPHHLSSFHEDLKTDFPHCYHVVFGFSHAIGDGHTFIRVCAAFAHLLDRVLSGEEVQDEEQICSFDLNEEYIRRAKECVGRFFFDEKLREDCMKEVTLGKPECMLVSHFLSPSDDTPKRTVLYNQTLDKETTTRLLERCRSAKVTLSSCLSAAGNTALVDLLKEKGIIQDNYVISNRHLVNMRRFWPKGTTEHVFGSYISQTLRQYHETPRYCDGKQFWEYVQRVHNKFYSLINDDKFLEKAMFVIYCYLSQNEDYLSPDLTFNSRGDTTKRFEGTKEITVTNLLSSTSIHNTAVPWDWVVGTLRGRLTHTMKYNTSVMREATAVRYSDLMHARLLDAARL